MKNPSDLTSAGLEAILDLKAFPIQENLHTAVKNEKH